MASPQGYGQPASYPAPQFPEEQQQPGFTNTTSPPPHAGDHPDGGKKKKRGYAAQAYDFGAGPNSALGGGSSTPQAPGYGGYAVQPEVPSGYGMPEPQMPAQQSYVQPPPPGAPVGYQPPDVAYSSAAVASPGVGPITQGMGQMGLGGAPQSQIQSQQPAARRFVLNQLYPTDLLNQPFNVSELELPPPPIVLPPNVGMPRDIDGEILISQ
jgi:protein transport protein SEC24